MFSSHPTWSASETFQSGHDTPFSSRGRRTSAGRDPYLPTDVCERIIGHIASAAHWEWDSGLNFAPNTSTGRSVWWRTLCACARVCKVWYKYSCYHIYGSTTVALRSRAHVLALANRVRLDGDLGRVVKHVTIAGCTQTDSRTPAADRGVSHLSIFAAMLASRLPNIQALAICDASWRVESVHPVCLRYLSCCRALTELALKNVAFAPESQFYSLLSALPSVRRLSCDSLSCESARGASRVPIACLNLRFLAVSFCDERITGALAALSTVAPLRRLTLTVTVLHHTPSTFLVGFSPG